MFAYFALSLLAAINLATLLLLFWLAGRILAERSKSKKDYEVKFMIRVPADAPDANFSVGLAGVTDSEGNTVPPTNYKWDNPTSDNESAVSFLNVTNSGQQITGQVRFGAPNPNGEPALANLNVALRDVLADAVVLNKALTVEVSAGAGVNFTGTFEIEGHPDDQNS